MKTNNLGQFLGDDGKTYEILESITQTTIWPLNEAPKIIDGFKSYRTSCGIDVNFIKGVFLTLDDVVLTPFK
jgi:hypothetical protein